MQTRMTMTTSERIKKSWDVRRALVLGILDRGDTLIAALELVPETGEGLTFDRWKAVVMEEVEGARQMYGNGEPLLTEQEITALASFLNPRRGW